MHSESYDCCDGLLATAPEGPVGMTLEDLFANKSSPKFKTYAMQPFSSGVYDKDFDPFVFGGRPIPLAKVEEKDRVWSSSNSLKEDSGDSGDPELITTHDFL